MTDPEGAPAPARARARTRMLPADMVWERRVDGTIYARSPHPLGPYPGKLTERLEYWADRAGDRVFLAERDAAGGWQTLSYRQALTSTRHVAQALVNRRLSAERPIAILSGNSIDHALLALGAMYAGVPYAPLSPAYSLLSRDHQALRYLYARLRPGLVFAEDGAAFDRALAEAGDAEIVTVVPPLSRPGTAWAELTSTAADGRIDDAHRRVGPDTIAKVLFTSGSTGSPKGVINTQRMLCANQEQLRTVMTFLADEPPVLCDWLPWNHTFGGNHNFGIVLYNGGTLYIDAGRPLAGPFATTVANLRAIACTAYFNVPRGFEMLLPVLQGDAAFREHFFSRLRILFYAAAGLRQEIADAFAALAGSGGEHIPWVTGLGATESAPFALCTGAQMGMTSRIGVPVPGVELKAAPVAGKLEARLRGPNITPGYWADEALTAAAFDDEGFYRMGDAIALANPDDPSAGFVFQGRIAEDFKLSTGTWVRVGPLRARLLAALGDLVHDVVITGHGREFVGALLFPHLPAWRARAGVDAEYPIGDLLRHEGVRRDLAERLRAFASEHRGSSTAPSRVAVLDTPPQFDAREVTDKGSLNQRAVLEARAAIVEQLYGADGDALVIEIAERSTSV